MLLLQRGPPNLNILSEDSCWFTIKYEGEFSSAAPHHPEQGQSGPRAWQRLLARCPTTAATSCPQLCLLNITPRPTTCSIGASNTKRAASWTPSWTHTLPRQGLGCGLRTDADSACEGGMPTRDLLPAHLHFQSSSPLKLLSAAEGSLMAPGGSS